MRNTLLNHEVGDNAVETSEETNRLLRPIEQSLPKSTK